MDDNKSEIE